MESRIKDGNFYVVQSFMVKDLKLKGLEKDLYAIIYGFSQAENQKFDGSLQYLADWTTSTKQGAMKALKSLQEKNLICKDEEFKNGIKFVKYYTTEFNRGIKQSLTGGIKQSLPNNINNNNINNNIDSSVTEIFDYWNSKNIIKHSQLTDDKIKAIQRCLKENSIDVIKECIDRYNTVITDVEYYFDTKWTLVEFLKQKNAMNDFKDDGSKWINYKNRKIGNNQNYEQRTYTNEQINGLFVDLDNINI